MNKSIVQVDALKAIIWGFVAIFLQMCIYYIIWMNPFVKGLLLQFSNDPSVKPYDYFGGLENWVQLRALYNIVLLAILIKLYLMFYTNIPGTGWLKGMCFGLIIVIIKVIPEAFNKWTLIVYPNELIVLQLVNGMIGFVIFGIVVSTIYKYFKVITVRLEAQPTGV